MCLCRLLASIGFLAAVCAPAHGQATKPDDPDREEMLRMDEAARIRERNETMSLPTKAELRARRALQIAKFVKNVDGFEAAIQKPKELKRYAQRIASFLQEGIGKPLPKRSAASPANLEQIARNLLPALNELKDLERRNIIDLSLRRTVISHLRTIEQISGTAPQN